MSTTRATIAVLGLGDIARKAHLPVLAARSDVDVIALASRSGRGAVDLAATHRFPLQATTVDEAIALRPMGALVLTASDSHADLACRLLEAGIAVYLEKPMALDLTGARLIADCVRRTGGLLMVGFNRRYAPLYLRLKELFPDGMAGQCHLVKARRAGGPAQSPVAAVWNDVIHLIDLSRWLMGDPERVHATVQHDADGAFAGLSALLGYTGGHSATLTQPVRGGGVRERVELYGAGVSAWVEEMDALHVQRGGITETHTFDPWTPTLTRRGFTAALDEFLDCLCSGRSPAQSAQDALKSHELAQTILDTAGA